MVDFPSPFLFCPGLHDICTDQGSGGSYRGFKADRGATAVPGVFVIWCSKQSSPKSTLKDLVGLDCIRTTGYCLSIHGLRPYCGFTRTFSDINAPCKPVSLTRDTSRPPTQRSEVRGSKRANPGGLSRTRHQASSYHPTRL